MFVKNITETTQKIRIDWVETEIGAWEVFQTTESKAEELVRNYPSIIGYADAGDISWSGDLSELDDVEITDPQDWDVLSYDATSEKFKNKDWVVDSEENTYEPDLDITDENWNVLVSFANWHIKTKNFDSSNISQGKIWEANQTYHFSFSVNTGIANITDSTNNDQTNATYATDWGAIKLPPNYTAWWTPVELVVRCHGTWGVIDSSTEFTGDVNIFLQNGMAVCDINGNPGQTSDANDRGYGTPKSYRSYCKGLNYILTNFNINGLFVYGTSMGGLASTWLAENFPGVKVQGAFCPCIDVFKEAFLRPRNGATQRSKICTWFWFSGTAPTFWTKWSYSANEQAYILANKEKIRGRNNMLKSTTWIDLDEYLSTYATVYTEQTAEQALYANAVKYRQVPIKIWHGIDDQTVPYKYSKYFVEMCRKGGCIADLRTFPSWTWHSARSVGTKTVTTKYGWEITVSNSIYEMYVWFDWFR